MDNASSGTIRKVMITGPRKAEVVSEPSRALDPREIRIRTLFSGISRGTEMNIYRGDAPFFRKTYDPELALFRDVSSGAWTYPVEFGYENVGSVEEVGSGVTEFSTGAVVVTYRPHREECIVDLDSRDPLLGDIVPVLPLPSEVAPENGVFVPLLGVALNALLDAQINLTESVVIFGAGVVGLLTVQLARRAGAGRVHVVEPIPARREFALNLGADEALDPAGHDVAEVIRAGTDGRGADVAIEASGTYRGLQEAVRVVGYNGRVVASSWLPGPGGDLYLGEEFHLNRVRICSSQSGGINPLLSERWDKARRTRAILSLAPALEFSGLITHRLPLDHGAEAYRIVDENPAEALQVILTYGGRN